MNSTGIALASWSIIIPSWFLQVRKGFLLADTLWELAGQLSVQIVQQISSQILKGEIDQKSAQSMRALKQAVGHPAPRGVCIVCVSFVDGGMNTLTA